MTDMNNKLIQFFENNQKLDLETQQLFWDLFLDTKIQECFQEQKPKYIKYKIQQLQMLLNVNFKIKSLDQNHIKSLFYQETYSKLTPFVSYSYFSLQFNRSVDFNEIYRNLIEMKNTDIGDKTLYYCFDKIIKLVINFFSEWTTDAIDMTLAYSLAFFSLIPNNLETSNLHTSLIEFSQKLISLSFYQNLNSQSFFMWDTELKKEVLGSLITSLPITIKKARYVKLLKNKF